MGALRVLVADDHRLMLAGVRRALERADDIAVVGEVTAGSEVLPAVAQTDPDVVLLDIRMPELDGLACLERIRAQRPELPVVMLSAYADADHIDAARARGASGYIVKSVNPVELPTVVQKIVRERTFSAHGLAADGGGAAHAAGLSERELTVLVAVARGLSNKEIARELWVTEQTVKFHLRNIFRKLDVSNRAEAARFVYQQLFPPPTRPGAPTGARAT